MDISRSEGIRKIENHATVEEFLEAKKRASVMNCNITKVIIINSKEKMKSA